MSFYILRIMILIELYIQFKTILLYYIKIIIHKHKKIILVEITKYTKCTSTFSLSQ